MKHYAMKAYGGMDILLLLLLLLLLFIVTANGLLPGGSGYTIRHYTQLTHITGRAIA
jgi:hypothetical protein